MDDKGGVMRFCSGLLALVLVAARAAHAVELGAIPQFDDLDLSPDGRHMLMVRSSGEAYDLVVRNFATGDDTTLLEGGAQNGLINWCRWANDARLVCSTRMYLPAPRLGHIARTRLIAIDADGSNQLSLIPRAKVLERRPPEWNAQVQDRVVSWLTDDPEHVLVQLNRDNPNRPSVFRLNVYTNNLVRVQRPRDIIRRWYSTHEGDVRLAIGYRRNRDSVVFRVNGRKLFEFEDLAFKSEIPPQPLGFSADQSEVYMSLTNGEDRHGIYRVDMATGKVLEPLFRDPDFDVFGRLIMHPDSGEPVGVSYLGHHPKLEVFDPTLKTLFADIRAALPGEQMRFVSSDVAYQRFVLQTYGGIGPAYYLYDRAAGQATLIGKDYPELDDDDVVDLEPVQYQTRDGLDIPAYLARPAGPGPFPTVLLPHGGPYARDSAEFDAWSQFLVDHGYAVLKPNYRGSVGYGEAYMQAGYKQWGLKMQEDLMDGLDWLVAEGIADPARVCVVGASYGGYSALVAAYKFTDKIHCAVSLAGISDLEDMVSRLYQFDLAVRNRERIQEGSELRANSPLRQVQSINVPVLLLHGNRDTVVRVKQSREFAAALERHGKPFRYVEQVNGDHFLSMSSQRSEFFVEMRDFLTEHLSPGAR